MGNKGSCGAAQENHGDLTPTKQEVCEFRQLDFFQRPTQTLKGSFGLKNQEWVTDIKPGLKLIDLVIVS